MIIIDGTTYNVGVKSIKRTADVLDKYAERTESGVLNREIIGVYFNYEITFVPTMNATEYSALWNKLTEPTEFHTVIVPSDTGNYTFTAYFSGVSDEIWKMDGTQTYSQNLTASFIAQSPARS